MYLTYVVIEYLVNTYIGIGIRIGDFNSHISVIGISAYWCTSIIIYNQNKKFKW